jgi:hypothetical protein
VGLTWKVLGPVWDATAELRGATRYYERRVLAWYALGRISEARAARNSRRTLPDEATAELHGPHVAPPRLLATSRTGQQ